MLKIERAIEPAYEVVLVVDLREVGLRLQELNIHEATLVLQVPVQLQICSPATTKPQNGYLLLLLLLLNRLPPDITSGQGLKKHFSTNYSVITQNGYL